MVRTLQLLLLLLPSLLFSQVQVITEDGSKPAIKLEAFVETEPPLYPGERARLVYRISFKGNIQLTKEILPLLDPKEMELIGQREIHSSVEGNWSIQEISQEVRALTPGIINFEASIIEGIGTLVGEPPIELVAKLPPFTLAVKPFPIIQQPLSFNGAIGKFSMETSMTSPQKINLGDKVVLSIRISGKEGIETVNLPEISCQPGFSGFFQVNDLPSAVETTANSKLFFLELTPLNTHVNAIPPLQFSYFNQETKAYVTLVSPSFPIEIQPMKVTNVPIQTNKNLEHWTPQLTVDKLREVPQLSNDIPNQPSISLKWLFTLMLACGTVLVIFQDHLQKYILRKKLKHAKSNHLFSEVEKSRNDPHRFFSLLENAFMMKLQEEGYPFSNPEEIPNHTPFQELHNFFFSIHKKRFSGEEVQPEEVFKEAKRLFYN